MEGLDLDTLDVHKGSEAGFELQLEHPATGAPLPIWITVQGPDSDAYTNATRELGRNNAERAARGKRVIMAEEEKEAWTVDFLALLTVTWRAGEGVTIGGQPFPAFSKSAAKTLYSDRRFPWIREQINRAIGNRANFLTGSARS